MLSFDDGPDPRFTPKILDTLKSRGAPAAFFVTGLSANAHPSLVQREYREGHEIGNHSYTHPHFDRISHAQLLVELNLTARLFESLIGARTILFRPPYGIDHQPETAEEVELLPVPQSLGYVIVGARIDPHDWGEPGGGPPPSPEEIARRVLEAARRGRRQHRAAARRRRRPHRDRPGAARDRRRAQGRGLRDRAGLAAARPVACGDDAAAHARASAGRRASTCLVFDLYHWARLASPPCSSRGSCW